ncbi:hypothetical protein EDD16DRAFT_1480669, partial [Pisolithus croceorrhizus]
WPSIYLSIDVIVNQETPPHLDKVSAPSLLDLVVSLGTHDSCLHISDIGTMIFLAGKVLTHSVPKWGKAHSSVNYSPETGTPDMYILT